MSLFLKDSFHIKTISAKELKLGLWAEDAALFIMPGGADIPYTKKLNGKGNQIIKNYITSYISTSCFLTIYYKYSMYIINMGI